MLHHYCNAIACMQHRHYNKSYIPSPIPKQKTNNRFSQPTIFPPQKPPYFAPKSAILLHQNSHSFHPKPWGFWWVNHMVWLCVARTTDYGLTVAGIMELRKIGFALLRQDNKTLATPDNETLATPDNKTTSRAVATCSLVVCQAIAEPAQSSLLVARNLSILSLLSIPSIPFRLVVL